MLLSQQAAQDQESGSNQSNPGKSFDPEGEAYFPPGICGKWHFHSKEAETPCTKHSRGNEPPDDERKIAPPAHGKSCVLRDRTSAPLIARTNAAARRPGDVFTPYGYDAVWIAAVKVQLPARIVQ